MPVIVVANPKGGVGKSTVATNVAGWLARQGHSVVLGDIDRCAPGANAATKRILLDVGTRHVSQVLDDASLAFARALRGPEGQEGVSAFLEKRSAKWVERT